MDLTSAVTLAIAILGAVLGVVNTWNTLSTQRVRLRVRPLWALTSAGKYVGIEVTNLSTFQVTIGELGTLHKRPWSKSPQRFVLTAPIFMDGGSWPRKLGPREQVTAYVEPHHLMHVRNLWGAYALTVCGELGYGRSPALKQLNEVLQRDKRK